MTTTTLQTHTAIRQDALLAPVWAEVVQRVHEAQDVSTFWLKFKDDGVRSSYRFAPGQFNMLYVPGYGEAAISISSDPDKPELIGHTVRFVGNVTNAVSRLAPGNQLSLRGPFGTPWPVEQYKGYDVVIAAGGIGLAPLRPAIYQLLANRSDYGKITILYGARTPQDLLFTREYDEWRTKDVEVIVTVDRGDQEWDGLVGVVPMFFYRLRMEPAKTLILTCGPEIMMRFVVYEGLARRVPNQHIYLSMERSMKCGQAQCGHCQLGPYFICKDGPVFTFDQLAPYFNVEHF
ncbi:MAG TPA: FAD/NAD(P)-binding protein [Terriglobales bacterium]|jgi:NAD(P)H-flavin reductase